MNKKINIIEVGPRDGFQNLKEYIPAKTKLEIIDQILQSGVKHMEVTSFVSPKAIPQLKDAQEIVEECLKRYKDVVFSALVPNLFGAKKAISLGIKEVAYVISLSKSHNMANINRTHEQSFEDMKNIMEEIPELKIWMGIATAFGCPIEGLPQVHELIDFMKKGYAFGIRNFILADTIGIATPDIIREFVKKAIQEFPDCCIQVHIHDTRNMGMLNTLAAIECGITDVQVSLGGLGGCPFAKGASGNTSTEDLVFMLNNMGYDTGIDYEKLLNAAKYEKSMIEGVYSGHNININVCD